MKLMLTVMDPDAPHFKWWDLFQYIALVYIMFLIPLRIGFAGQLASNMPSHACDSMGCPISLTHCIACECLRVIVEEVSLLSFAFFVDLVVDIYFIVDIWVNFNTAGTLRVEPILISTRKCGKFNLPNRWGCMWYLSLDAFT
jgi:hypothetical protein